MKHALLLVVSLLVLGGCTAPPAPPASNGASFVENFDSVEALPPGWVSKAGAWDLVDEPQAPSTIHVIEQTARMNDSSPLYIAESRGTYGNVEITVKARPMAGYRALSGGIAFRYVDSANYYVARFSGTEHDVRFFEYAKGVRTKYNENFDRAFPVGTWVELKVRAVGNAMTVSVDGGTAITVHDSTLQVGMVGLWVQDDSVTQFDDVRVTRL